MNLELPKGPISGEAHFTIQRDSDDGILSFFKDGVKLKMERDFYMPIVIETKDKALSRVKINK